MQIESVRTQRHEETAFNAETAEAQRSQRQRDFTLRLVIFSAVSASPKGISCGASLRPLRRKSYFLVIHAIALRAVLDSGGLSQRFAIHVLRLGAREPEAFVERVRLGAGDVRAHAQR